MIQTMWGNFAPHDKQISCLQTHSYKIINIVKLILWQVFLVTSFFALSFSENGCSGKIYVDDHYHCYEILRYCIVGAGQGVKLKGPNGLHTWDQKEILMKQNPPWLAWDGMGGGNHHTKFQNRAITGVWENLCFIHSNGQKTTFEWPKMVSEESFPRSWGVLLLVEKVTLT